MVHWQGDFYHGKNLAVATSNNVYLDGLSALPEHASRENKEVKIKEFDFFLFLVTSRFIHIDSGCYQVSPGDYVLNFATWYKIGLVQYIKPFYD